MAKYVTLTNLERFWQGIKAKLNNKVDVVEGKGLSTNDLTNELKEQYDLAEANVINSIKVNGAAAEVEEKAVNLTIPTKTSELSNDANFVTSENLSTNHYDKSAIDEKVTTINEAIAAAATGKVTITIVEQIPEVGSAQQNVIYFVQKPSSDDEETNDVYNEYMLINGAIELIGSTAVDLTGYVKKTDMEEITEEEVDLIFST